MRALIAAPNSLKQRQTWVNCLQGETAENETHLNMYVSNIKTDIYVTLLPAQKSPSKEKKSSSFTRKTSNWIFSLFFLFFFKYLKSYLYYKEYIHFSSLTLFFGNKTSRIFCMYVFCCLLLVTDKWLNYKYNSGNISTNIILQKLEGKWHPLNWYMKVLTSEWFGQETSNSPKLILVRYS